MGKLTASSRQCPDCLQFHPVNNSKAHVTVRFKIGGLIKEFCPSCTALHRFQLAEWLMKEDKEIRTIPEFNIKTKRRVLVVLTDPADYEGEDPHAVNVTGGIDMTHPEALLNPSSGLIQPEGLLMAPHKKG
jgi:hypothetical protein